MLYYENFKSILIVVHLKGVLITYCEDTTLSLWNLRQKQPAVSNSKKLINEKYVLKPKFINLC